MLLVVALCVTGCGKNKPKNLPQEAYDQGVRVVSAIEKYYDGELTFETLKEICDEAKDLIFNYDTQNLSALESAEVAILSTELVRLSMVLTNVKNDSMFEGNSSEELKPVYEELKESLNL